MPINASVAVFRHEDPFPHERDANGPLLRNISDKLNK